MADPYFPSSLQTTSLFIYSVTYIVDHELLFQLHTTISQLLIKQQCSSQTFNKQK